MSFTQVWQAIVGDFVLCVDQEKLPPLSGYFPDYVKSGCVVAPDEYRLVPLTPDSLRLLITSSDCLTDCMLELQSKYQQFVPDRTVDNINTRYSGYIIASICPSSDRPPHRVQLIGRYRGIDA